MNTAAASPVMFQRHVSLPRNCTFDPHDWDVPSRYWHPVAFSTDLRDNKPFAPPPEGQGPWMLDAPRPDAVRALCRDADSGRLRGFSLMGSEAVRRKAVLLGEMDAPV